MSKRQAHEAVRAGARNVGSPLRSLTATGVISENWASVRAYLRRHRNLSSLLPKIINGVRNEFGPGADLSLDVYRDPEIDDQYLTLRVSLPRYGPDTMNRIEAVSRRFERHIRPSSGYLLLTTDFRPARATHAV